MGYKLYRLVQSHTANVPGDTFRYFAASLRSSKGSACSSILGLLFVVMIFSLMIVVGACAVSGVNDRYVTNQEIKAPSQQSQLKKLMVNNR
jgi:hypothetical protein